MSEKINILFEDNHLLIVEKPHGLLTQPDKSERRSLLGEVRAYLKERDQRPGNVYLEVVHRLDRVAGGLVLCAKSSKALSRLMESMRKGEIEKRYYALVEKWPLGSVGTLRDYLIHDDYKARIVKEGGKEAVLHYKVLQRSENGILLEILLTTGRYHQIRAQLANVEAPILGDKKYGSLISSPTQEGIALFSGFLKFQHPVSKDIIEKGLCPLW